MPSTTCTTEIESGFLTNTSRQIVRNPLKLCQSNDVGDKEDEPVRPDRGVEDGKRLHPDRCGGGGEPGDQEDLFTHSDNCGGKNEQRQEVIP